MQYLTLWDLVLTPVYLLVIHYLAKQQRDKRYPPGHPLRRYYLPGLWVKLGGAIFIALVYQFYYGGGDTFNFFTHSQIINSSLDDSLSTWFGLITHQSPDKNPELYAYTSRLLWYNDPASYAVAVIGAIFGLINGTTYIPIALLFAYVSFSGIWAMYRTFVNIYPKLYKPLAIAFLFIPSVFVWGSAMFKDTVCMFGLGWMLYATFRIFINKDFSFKNVSLLVLSFYLVAVIKVYILLAFLPALGLWLLMTYSHKIQSVGLRWIVNMMFIAASTAMFLFFAQQFSKELNKYSLEKIAKTAESTRGWIAYASGEEGSAYDLGSFQPNVGGMLMKFPEAVVVTLYRPFLWESKKIITLVAALESLAFSILTLMVFFKVGMKVFRQVIKDPTLMFCLIFSLIFAFAVGITSYNFGALSRYKIPCLPFYSALLLVLLYSQENTAVAVKKIKGPRSINKVAFPQFLKIDYS